MDGNNLFIRDYGDIVQYRIFENAVGGGEDGYNASSFDSCYNEWVDFGFSWEDVLVGDIPTDPYIPGKTKQEWLDSLDEKHRENYLLSEKKRALQNSLKRSKDMVYDYAQSNRWEYMITFTFEDGSCPFPYPENSAEFDANMNVVKDWLKYVVKSRYKNYPEKLMYLIVPELGERSGRFHVHGLLAYTQGLTFTALHKDHDGRSIYACEDWQKGFSTCKRIYDNIGACSYILKYITKQVALVSPGRSRYLHSANLKKCKVEKKLLSSDQRKELLYELMTSQNLLYCKSVTNDFGMVINYIAVKK